MRAGTGTYNTGMSLLDRWERRLPNGVPCYVGSYDGGGVTAERYTAVFAGFLSARSPGSTFICW